MARNTRQRILVAALLLFNDKGVMRTALNEIADEVDISPGNLHYHFRKKADVVEALVAEFEADARKVLQPPEEASIDDFWLFLHLLLEFAAAYRFLLRDGTVAREYPKAARAMRNFANGLEATFQMYLASLAHGEQLDMDVEDIVGISRNLTVIALLSDRYDELVGTTLDADEAALQVARAIIQTVQPYATPDASAELKKLAAHYSE